MIRKPLQRTTAVVVLFSQLLLVALGGPFMVQCEGGNGHQAVELAHVDSCDESGFALASGEAAMDASTPEQWSAGECVDTALSQAPVLRQEDRPSPLFAAIPVLLVYPRVELPETPARAAQTPDHLSSPDSPESLARSVILLI